MQLLQVQLVNFLEQVFEILALFRQLVDRAGPAIGIHTIRPFPGSHPAGTGHRIVGITVLPVLFRTTANQPAGGHCELCLDTSKIQAVLAQVFANTLQTGDIHIAEKVPVSRSAVGNNQAAVNVLTDGVDRRA